VGFTVLSMSLSLIAVFIPMLLLGGLPGRLFHEFAVTLSISILISLLVSLTMTSMLAALVTMYIVLGILYESTIHPLTILSTLPSAGVGVLFALIMLDAKFTLIAFIGLFLLIGIVNKNASQCCSQGASGLRCKTSL